MSRPRRKERPAVRSGEARGHRASDRYDDEGFPITSPGELGPPGIRYTVCRPAGLAAETLASCLDCRRLVLCFAAEDGSSSLWGMDALARLSHRAWLRMARADLGQEFAPGCPGCGIAPHGAGVSTDMEPEA